MSRIKKMLSSSRYIYLVITISIVFSLLYNTPYYTSLFRDNPSYLIMGVAVGIVTVSIMWYILGLNRWVFLIAGGLIFILSAALSYYTYNYQVMISVGLMRVIWEADPREVSAFFDIQAVLWVLLSGIVFALFAFWRFQLKKLPSLKAILISLAVLGIAVSIVQSLPPRLVKRNVSMPYVYMEHLYHYGLESYRIGKLLNNKLDVAKVAEFELEDIVEGLTVVVMVGESVRSDHLSINGYDRPTSTYMEESGAYSFDRVLSCRFLTSHAIVCMFTRGTVSNWKQSLEETSFLSIFRELGFETYWLSNQSRLGHDTWVGSVASEADFRFFCDDYRKGQQGSMDTCMLPEFEDAVNSSAKNKLIVLHMFGSHLRYDDRYAEEFEVFTPVCDKNQSFTRCEGEELINIYDNSLVASDDFYRQVIDILKDKNALVFYTSDHAEPLGENGKRSRSEFDYKILVSRHVPFLVWLSDSLKENTDIAQTISANTGKPISHDYLIYSVLDCAGVKSSFIDTALSICNPDMVPDRDPYILW